MSQGIGDAFAAARVGASAPAGPTDGALWPWLQRRSGEFFSCSRRTVFNLSGTAWARRSSNTSEDSSTTRLPVGDPAWRASVPPGALRLCAERGRLLAADRAQGLLRLRPPPPARGERSEIRTEWPSGSPITAPDEGFPHEKTGRSKGQALPVRARRSARSSGLGKSTSLTLARSLSARLGMASKSG